MKAGTGTEFPERQFHGVKPTYDELTRSVLTMNKRLYKSRNDKMLDGVCGGIAEYFENQEHIKIRTETLNNYLKILENAKIIYRCPRFDVK